MDFIYGLHKTMNAHKLILAYEGEFTQEITKSVLSMAERNLDSQGEESSTKRKVFNVMVECLQNIVKHADEMEGEAEDAIFLIGKEKESYVISSGNYMYAENVDGLKSKLDEINSLDKDGLKQLYKEIIKGGSLSEKGGAGLGFIDMARKSGNKLIYNFEKLDDTLAFFSLQTKIVRAGM